jgi:hypothetical protein
MPTYSVYLIRWEMSYGVHLLSTEVCTTQLKVIAHVPLNELVAYPTFKPGVF